MATDLIAVDRESVVFLLGAGFSRAISSAMPLMPELGTAVAAKVRADPRLWGLLADHERQVIDSGHTPLGNVEIWLSALMSDQPFLSSSENLQRRALAAEVADIVSAFITARQATAQSVVMPTWLTRLVTSWHFGRATVITLNYDTLIESAVQQLVLRSRASSARAMAHHVLADVPPLVPASRWGHEAVDTMRLLKLHGSTNWFGRSEASDIFSIVRDDHMIPAWPPLDSADVRNARPAVLDGLTPLVVPPTANKAALYANATMAGIWRSARRALTAATRVVIFGYSLPSTDTSMRALLSMSIPPGVSLAIVDPQAERVEAALGSLGLDVSATCQVGDVAFDRLITEVENHGRLGEAIAEVLATRPAPYYVGVETPDRQRWPVVGLDVAADAPILDTAPAPLDPDAGSVRTSETSLDIAVARDWRGARARFPSGVAALLLDARHEQESTGGTNVIFAVGHSA